MDIDTEDMISNIESEDNFSYWLSDRLPVKMRNKAAAKSINKYFRIKEEWKKYGPASYSFRQF